MKKNDTYYVMVEPTSKSKDEFNPLSSNTDFLTKRLILL